MTIEGKTFEKRDVLRYTLQSVMRSICRTDKFLSWNGRGRVMDWMVKVICCTRLDCSKMTIYTVSQNKFPPLNYL